MFRFTQILGYKLSYPLIGKCPFVTRWGMLTADGKVTKEHIYRFTRMSDWFLMYTCKRTVVGFVLHTACFVYIQKCTHMHFPQPSVRSKHVRTFRTFVWTGLVYTNGARLTYFNFFLLVVICCFCLTLPRVPQAPGLKRSTSEASDTLSH